MQIEALIKERDNLLYGNQLGGSTSREMPTLESTEIILN